MEFDYIAFLLLLLYSLLFLFELRQFIQIFYLKNKKINYRNGIIFALILSAALRIIFWTKVMIPTEASGPVMMTIFYLPVWLNFAGISLLCVFYANTIYEERYGSWPKYICIVLNVIFFILDITIGALIDTATTGQSENIVIYRCYIYYAVFIDAFIACLVGYFGYNFVYDNNYHSYRHWILLPRSIETFAVINWLIVACFFIRSVFVFVFSLPQVKRSAHTEIEFNGEHGVTPLLMLFFFLITEWVPNSAMLYLLWKPNTKKPKKYKSANYLKGEKQADHGFNDEPDSPGNSQKQRSSFSFKFANLLPEMGGSTHSLSGLLPFPKLTSGLSSNKVDDSHNRKYRTVIEDPSDLLSGQHDNPESHDTLQDNLLTENDLRDQGFNVRHTSVEDSVVRVIYNPSDSYHGSVPSDERGSGDFGQHTLLSPEEIYDYSHEYHPENPPPTRYTNLNPNRLPSPRAPPARPHLSSYPIYQASMPSSAIADEENMKGSGIAGMRSANEGGGTPERANQVGSLPHNYRSREHSKLSSTSSTVISSLYHHPNPTVIGRPPSNQQLYDLAPADLAAASKNEKFNSFSSTASGSSASGGGVHLDPSVIYKKVDNPGKEYRQYDLNQKYADTIGPRDILNAKL